MTKRKKISIGIVIAIIAILGSQILMNHHVMLQRNLIYTGITRAKQILVMVGTKKALAYAVHNVTVTKRNTLLKERFSNG